LSRSVDGVAPSHAVETRRQAYMLLAGKNRIYAPMLGHIPDTAPGKGGLGSRVVP
jgi:hypothetical protein